MSGPVLVLQRKSSSSQLSIVLFCAVSIYPLLVGDIFVELSMALRVEPELLATFVTPRPAALIGILGTTIRGPLLVVPLVACPAASYLMRISYLRF